MKGYTMEYARLTDGQTTLIVVDQDNAEYSAWPFAIKIKTGTERFKHFDSRTSLANAVEAAVREFRNRSNVWGLEY
jgi:uncharacterized protein YbdZ (MbtH family)